MIINKIAFTPFISKSYNDAKSYNSTRDFQLKETKPLKQFAYQDFNVNFGARLFRTPANFYAQKFNQENMPITMKKYLEADFEDRQNMPPEQLMREAYYDLKFIDSLDFVPRVQAFKDEPLFADLTDTPSRKAQTGIISEIQALDEEFEATPLFKNGSSNLGMYVLRKIYLEGKTLKEINQDFRKDLSDDYKDLITSKIDSYAIKAYGIKYPKSGFWNSFYPTRKEFPYEYKPRKVELSRLGQTHQAGNKSGIEYKNIEDNRPPKFKVDNNFKDKGKKLGDAIINGHGDVRQTERELRRKGISDSEELSFVSKYLGQIMSIALENIHASDEMRAYFDRYQDMTKSQKAKLESYWRDNSHMKELQSTAISDTIKLFYEAYGADGNNDEFRDLIAYAEQIKPAREDALRRYEARRQELEEVFAAYDFPLENVEKSLPMMEDVEKPLPKNLSEEEQMRILEEEAIKQGAEIFTFESPDGDKYKIVGNVDELYEAQMNREFSLMPKRLVRKFLQHAKKSPHASYEYKKTAGLITQVPDFVRDDLMPLEECLELSRKLNDEFDKKYAKLMMAGEQALVDVILAKGCEDALGEIFAMNATQLVRYIQDILHIEEWDSPDRINLDTAYDNYSKPVNNKYEQKQLAQAFVKYLTLISPDSPKWEKYGDIDDICALLTKTLQTYPKEKAKFEKLLRERRFMEEYGGTARLLVDPNVSDSVKSVKAKVIATTFINTYIEDLVNLLARDSGFIQKYIKDPGIRRTLAYQNSINNF